jgi:hypothetical protein
MEAVLCTTDQIWHAGWNIGRLWIWDCRDLSRAVAGGGGSIPDLTGTCTTPITASVEAEQSGAALTIVSAEPARTQATVQRPVLGGPVICTCDRCRRRAALELRAVTGRRARPTKRNASVCARLSLDQLASGQEGDRCSECAEKASSWRGADEASCPMVEG